MKSYFESLESLQQFTSSLKLYGYQVTCKKCHKCDQFVAHDFIYKKQKNGRKKIIGKRIYCSNRSGRKGCGSTLRLYLKETLPRLQYSTSQLQTFIEALCRGTSIQYAYKTATQVDDPRNAYRWLNKLFYKLSDYRVLIASHYRHLMTGSHFRTRRFQLLLPTLERLLSLQSAPSINDFHLSHQKGFI